METLLKELFFSAKDSSPYVGVMYGNVTVSNDVTFPGDLTVGATTTSNDLQTLTVDYKTTINLGSTTLINDKNGAIVINKDTTDPTRDGHISGGTIKTVVAYSVPTGITPPSDGNFVYIDDGQSTYGSLPAPTVAGKSFKGWYKESAYTNEVTGTSPVDLNVHTLYGKFVDSYTVTFSVPTGTVTPSTVDVDTGGKVSEPTVTWADGTVAGWYSDPTFTDTSKWNFDTNTVTAPITLYAKFMCTVTFDSQGGDPITGTTLVYGNTIPIPANPTYEGFKFGGWFTDSECSPYNMWNFFTSKVTGNITLYAKWGTEYTITNPVKPDNGEIVILANMALNGSMVLFRVIPDEHYEIDGLPIVQTTSENTDISVTTLNNNRYAFIMPSSNVIISASFKKIHYTVTLDKQNGSTPDTQSIAYGETINKPQNPEKEGYTFVNWYMNPKGTGNAYDFNTPVTSNITLYAKWDINPPEPEPVVQDGWVISNEGWQYVLNGQFLNDGFHYIIDQYGEH